MGKTSTLFKKTSGLIDARIGRGLLSTFHANYWIFRFPLDLVFHSNNIVVDKLRVLKHIGSDHFPIYCSFILNAKSNSNSKSSEKVEEDIDEIIEDGKQYKSDRQR